MLNLLWDRFYRVSNLVVHFFEAQKRSYKVQSKVDFVTNFFKTFLAHKVVIFLARPLTFLVYLVINMNNNTLKYYAKISITTEVAAIFSLCTKISHDVTFFSEHPVYTYYVSNFLSI